MNEMAKFLPHFHRPPVEGEVRHHIMGKRTRSVAKYIGNDLIDTNKKIVRPRKPKTHKGKTLQDRMNYHDKMVGYYHRMKQYHIAMYYSPDIMKSKQRGKK